MKKVMVTGHFDPLHEIHLSLFEEGKRYGEYLVCIVATDAQAVEKKGKVNIPAEERCRIVDLILTGLGIPHVVVQNIWDKDNTTLGNTLRFWQPAVLLRGNDKTPADLPQDEAQVCSDLGISVEYAHFNGERHGRNMTWGREL